MENTTFVEHMKQSAHICQSFNDANERNEKKFAVLIDPDKVNGGILEKYIALERKCRIDYYFVGGSLVVKGKLNETIRYLKSNSDVPVVIFPGSAMQVCNIADAILLLSLISGRNPDLLIGRHVEAAPVISKAGLEAVPVGYMLIDGGKPTSVSYMSNTTPIPADKPDIAVATAMAGQMLGLKLIYMDAGSGAVFHIPTKMIRQVKQNITLPLIVGGGIRTPDQARDCCAAGADIIVAGTVLEQNISLTSAISHAIHSFHTSGIVSS